MYMNILIKNFNTDHLNILMILVSFCIASVAPLELLLLSYAFLGPAHYLTEISWLHDKQYFTNHAYDYTVLYILTLLLFLLPSFSMILLISAVCYSCISIIYSIRNHWWGKVFILTIYTIVILCFHHLPIINTFLLFLPTLIHVFCFTLLFMLAGTLKNPSTAGFCSVILLLLCPLGFFMLDHMSINLPYYNSVYAQDNIHNLSNIIKPFTDIIIDNHIMHDTNYVIRFIAFAYFYHYLNWFGKTKVIKWHKISLKRKIIITVIYITSIMVYYYNYRLGFAILLYLSFLHVILELPLNFLTLRRIIGIITPHFRRY
ncbi:hypothetical protein NOVO_03515 [Rickettsiales bacterium Ac37b]|nr:hypothetical protein NOVO_03515 [Rickettsiales bacterium Ac37b]